NGVFHRLDAVMMCVFLFFFSSRRRHTRFSRDWSSDVCSSDLSALQLVDAMMPFIDLGIVDPVALAENVLRSFGFKQLEGIIQQPAPMGEGAPPEGAPSEGMPPEGMPPEGMPPEMASAAPAGPLPLEEQSGVPADMEAAAIDIITQLPQDLLDMAHAQGLTDEFLVELFGQVIASGQDVEQFIEVMRARLSQPAMPAPAPM